MAEIQGLRGLNSRVQILESNNTSQEHSHHPGRVRLNKILDIKKDYVKDKIEDINKIFEDSITGYESDVSRVRFAMEFTERYVNQYADFIEVPATGRLKKQIAFNLVESYLDRLEREDVNELVENYLDAISGKFKINVVVKKVKTKPAPSGNISDPVATHDNYTRLQDIIAPPLSLPPVSESEPGIMGRLTRRMSVSSIGSRNVQDPTLKPEEDRLLKKSVSSEFKKKKRGGRLF